MDSQTHIELALKITQALGTSPETAIASLFPQIDRNPPTLHRLYAHTVFKARPITRFGLRFLSSETFGAQEQGSFEYRRFQEEAPRYRAYLSKIPGAATLFQVAEDDETALTCFVSHLYLDTYNQPTQPFAPLNVYCSGQWSLWKKLGDFRKRLYTTKAIDHLRRELFAHPLWSGWKDLPAPALMQAMMVRMCAFSEGKLPDGLVEHGMNALGLRMEEAWKLSKALDLLVEFEGVLNGLHEKHLAGSESLPEKPEERVLA